MRTKVSVFFVSFTMLSELTQCSSQDPLTARLPQNLLSEGLEKFLASAPEHV